MGFNEARELFSGHYLLLAFLASLGAIQLAAARASLRGLWIAGSRSAVRWLGIGLLTAGIVLYYLMPLWIPGPWGTIDSAVSSRPWTVAEIEDLSAARNVNDTRGGLSGNTQAILLLAGFSIAFATSAGAGALVTRTRRRRDEARSARSGIGALVNGNIADASVVSWQLVRGEPRRPDWWPTERHSEHRRGRP